VQTASLKNASPLAYTDYRAFLAEYVRERKAANATWSYGVWARQLGLRSPSTLIMILNGQRHPGPRLVENLCRHFKLGKEDAAYFRDLVRLAKARSDVQLSLGLLKQLEQRHPGRGFRLLDQDSFLAISNWYCYAIRELVGLKGFREDAAWISRQLQFPVSAERVEDAIATLLRLGLLARNSRGRLIATSQHLDTKSDQGDAGLRRYHEQILAQAAQSLSTLPSREREVSGGCFAIRERDLPRAKELIRSFQIELCNELESRDGDRVYQIEVAFYPLTKPSPEALQ
jgi:uncharacterized protein (TIGR02147 family)